LHHVCSAITTASNKFDRVRAEDGVRQPRGELRHLTGDPTQVLEALLGCSWVLGTELRRSLNCSHSPYPSN